MSVPRRVTVLVLLAAVALGGCFGEGESPAASGSAPNSGAATPSTSEAPSIAPSASATASPTPIPTATPTPVPTATPAPSPTPVAFTMVTVVGGDTLGTIAARYDTTWQSLVYWNRDRYAGLDPEDPSYNPNLLVIGWVLRLLPGVVVPFDAPLPTPVPTPQPSAPPSGAASILVGSGSRSTTMVALTFDLGGRIEPALPIMTWLRDHGVPATIFVTGDMADSTATDVGRQVLARIDARPDLFDLGNHSYSHPDMTELSWQAIHDEVTSAEAAIDRYAAQSPRPFFRPPYGAWNSTMLSAVGSAGYRYSVLWDVDTIDWKPIADGGPTAQQIVDKVLGRAQGGSIVLMHLGGYETLDALPGIVSGLRAAGYRLVTLGTMLGG